jgi:uncharacterized protein
MSLFVLACTLFFSLLAVSLPFLLIGIAVSSLLAVFVGEGKLAAVFPRNRFLGAITGCFLGFFIPLGLYGTIPIARRFFRQNVPLAAVFSFLIGSPVVNIITLWITWQSFADRPSIWLSRSIWGVIAAIGLGILFSYARLSPPKTAEISPEPSPEVDPVPDNGELGEIDRAFAYEYKSSEASDFAGKAAFGNFLDNFTGEVLEFAGWLILTSAIATFCQLLPRDELLTWGNTSFTAILVQLLFGCTLSVNSLLSVLVPGSLTMSLFPGSLLAYLLLSPLVNLQGFGLLLVAFPPKIVFYIMVLMLLITVLASLTLDFYLP